MSPSAPLPGVARGAVVTFIALGLGLQAVGCGPARRSEPLVGDREITDAQVEVGQRVFARHCDECHPGGAAGLGPALNDKPLPGWLVKQQVRAGLGAMPSFPEEEISDPDLDALTEYVGWLRSLSQTGT